MWIDSHCHLDAPEFAPDREAVLARARAAGVSQLVLPAVRVEDFAGLQSLARRHGLAYALGLHPLYVHEAPADALEQLARALKAAADDPLLVAVGEIGLDFFVPGLDRALQEHFFHAQLKLAQACRLPVLLHGRRSADGLLKGLRRHPVPGGVAHAFNGSRQQAQALLDCGLVLGFGGAMTFDRALRLRQLATELPDSALVLETDSPDIPPHWLYRTAAQRAQGQTSRNEPAELPRIAAELARLRGWSLDHAAGVTSANLCRVLPRLCP